MNEKPNIPYEKWIERALSGVVSRALTFVNENGFPGDHHFFITFETNAVGVELPKWVIKNHPYEMTIVLQHQFEDLKVKDEFFSVTLYFDGRPTNLVIPFSSIIAFADPSVNFGLQLKLADGESHENKIDILGSAGNDKVVESSSETLNQKREKKKVGEVITLDNFRKKK